MEVFYHIVLACGLAGLILVLLLGFGLVMVDWVMRYTDRKEAERRVNAAHAELDQTIDKHLEIF